MQILENYPTNDKIFNTLISVVCGNKNERNTYSDMREKFIRESGLSEESLDNYLDLLEDSENELGFERQ